MGNFFLNPHLSNDFQHSQNLTHVLQAPGLRKLLGYLNPSFLPTRIPYLLQQHKLSLSSCASVHLLLISVGEEIGTSCWVTLRLQPCLRTGGVWGALGSQPLSDRSLLVLTKGSSAGEAVSALYPGNSLAFDLFNELLSVVQLQLHLLLLVQQ